MTGCKGYDLRESDAMIRAHQRGQYAGRESGQEYFADRPADRKINDAGHTASNEWR